MARKLEIYKCESCGNIVEVVHGGAGELVCCGEPMVLMQPKTTDQGKEKHVPVKEKIDGGFRIKVGENAHPMAEDHFIEWVQVISGDEVCRVFLKPGQEPKAEFLTKADEVTARELCNVHGLWKS